jgi:hypothetical protein
MSSHQTVNSPIIIKVIQMISKKFCVTVLLSLFPFVSSAVEPSASDCVNLDELSGTVLGSLSSRSLGAGTTLSFEVRKLEEFDANARRAITRTPLPGNSLWAVVFRNSANELQTAKARDELSKSISAYAKASFDLAKERESSRAGPACLTLRIHVARIGVLAYLLQHDVSHLYRAEQILREAAPLIPMAEVDFWLNMSRALAALHAMPQSSADPQRNIAEQRFVSAINSIWSSVILSLEAPSLNARGDKQAATYCPEQNSNPVDFSSDLPLVYSNLWSLISERSTLEKGLAVPDTLAVYAGLLLRRNHCAVSEVAKDSLKRLSNIRTSLRSHPAEKMGLSLAVMTEENSLAILALESSLKELGKNVRVEMASAEAYAAHRRASASAEKMVALARHDWSRTIGHTAQIRVLRQVSQQLNDWANPKAMCPASSSAPGGNASAVAVVSRLAGDEGFDLENGAPSTIRRAMEHLIRLAPVKADAVSAAGNLPTDLQASRALAYDSLSMYDSLTNLEQRVQTRIWATTLAEDRLKIVTRLTLNSNNLIAPTLAYTSAALDAGILADDEMKKLGRSGDPAPVLQLTQQALSMNPLNAWNWERLLAFQNNRTVSETGKRELRRWTRGFLDEMNVAFLSAEPRYSLSKTAVELLRSLSDYAEELTFASGPLPAACAAPRVEQATRLFTAWRCPGYTKPSPLAGQEVLEVCSRFLIRQKINTATYTDNIFPAWESGNFEVPDLVAIRASFHARKRAQDGTEP